MKNNIYVVIAGVVLGVLVLLMRTPAGQAASSTLNKGLAQIGVTDSSAASLLPTRKESRKRGQSEVPVADQTGGQDPNGAVVNGHTITFPAGWPANFDAAKRLLEPIYAANPVEFYCGCTFDPNNNWLIDTKTCGIKSDSYANRVDHIEWEHVVPADTLGKQRKCWRDASEGVDGRKYCRKVDPIFRKIEADPFGLVPASGALNALRSDMKYGEVQGEQRNYGACDFEVDREYRRIEPPQFIKGDVARIWFYYEKRYGLQISPADHKLFEAWDQMDPEDAWERERHRQIMEAISQ